MIPAEDELEEALKKEIETVAFEPNDRKKMKFINRNLGQLDSLKRLP